MAYYAVPTSLTSFATMDVTKENKVLLHSLSSKGLCNHSAITRSYSSNLMYYSFNRIQATSMQPKHKSSHSETSRDMNMRQKGINIQENMVESSEEDMINRANWVHILMKIKTYWRGKLPKESMDPDIICKHNMNNQCDCDEDVSFCVAGYEEGDEKEEDGQGVTCDCDSFSKFLVPVSWYDTKLFSKLALLCNMAYAIPQIKAKDLERYNGLQFVTSSLEKKGDVTKIKAKLDQDSICVPMDASVASHQDGSEKGDDNEQKHQTKDLLSLASKSQQHSGNEDCNGREDSPHEEADETPQVQKSKLTVNVAALTMTVVAAAGTAMGLQLVRSSSCEWFVCDDPNTHTRCFVIQGSYSVASWQANLSFEPTTFEDTDVLVHSGIYEAAKGIYEQFMPEIMDHLKRHGDSAKFQFTGHSLGGSLSLLVYLMLLTRKVVSPSTLQPVVTFGSPFVLCGGQRLLNDLGLDESHIQCVIMHRDIVPRIFSCSFPNHVITVLKRFNGSFESHPCLIKKKLLYSPLGKIFILQPDEKTSPSHPFLPAGSGLYALDNSKCGYSPIVLRAFLNQPHPLETLSNPTAYGSDGTVLRDHDCNNYLKAVNGVFGQHSNIIVRTGRSKKPPKIFKKKMRK
ncbi:phospholipase A1 PLIP1, chloroplastic [Cajanus cajan]|uniref:Lipase n=1 Tax=Cajanus cajan TaxID=3821 RepID=A0A151SMS7_CAJCA|nr:phospholipase A1 PLIP1, chloroplastic [Cajanus cajan]KYP56068.1 Lipase [Cajanus cajan]